MSEARATFRVSVPKRASYDLFAWWVSSSNRATNTPFVVHTKERVDTVRVDQTIGGSTWYKIGTFTFGGTPVDSVVVTNQAVGKTNPAYVVVDGLKLVSFDRSLTSVQKAGIGIPDRYALFDNYPNPFNPSTTISFQLPKASSISLNVFNALGQLVATLADERKEAGYYTVKWNANVSSGIYFYRLQAHQISGQPAVGLAGRQAGEFSETKKMILLR